MMAIDQGKGRGGQTVVATSSNWNITDINNHRIAQSDVEDSRKQKQKQSTMDSPSTIAVDDTMGAQQDIITISSTQSSSSNVVDVLNNSNDEFKEEVTEEGLLPACTVKHADIDTAMSQIGWQVYKSHDTSFIRENDEDDASLQSQLGVDDDEHIRHSSSDSDPSARETMTSMIVYNNEGGENDATRNYDAISADDFLPLFTYSLVGKLCVVGVCCSPLRYIYIYMYIYIYVCVCMLFSLSCCIELS